MDPLAALLEQVRQERQVDLRCYKTSFLQRRLAVRLRARDCPDYTAYAKLLRREPEEYGPLLEVLSIRMTRFFRDATTFQAIEEKVLPDLLARRAAERRLRLWSAGCAAGEEPYSLALVARAALGPALPEWKVEIIATDTDTRALQQAASGQYEAQSFQGVAAHYQPLVERYFSPGPTRQLAAEVRAMVTLQRHDLSRDPIPANLDMILCRNVLIYFDHDQQTRLYQAFYDALRSGCFLVLGKSEILPMAWGQRFAAVELREHIYRKSG